VERHLEDLLCEEVLAKIAHRHLVLTIPRLLRPLFRRRRELLTELGRAAAEATSELVRRGVGGEARPGIVVSIATAEDLVQWHPHLHLLTTDGANTAGGSWKPHESARALAVGRRRHVRVVERRSTSPPGRKWSFFAKRPPCSPTRPDTGSRELTA
jgi:hypothetical protein